MSICGAKLKKHNLVVMRTQLEKSVVSIEKEHLSFLLKEVKETIAKDVYIAQPIKNQPIFSAAQLWDIQRRMKLATRRR